MSARDLLERVLGPRAAEFDVEITPPTALTRSRSRHWPAGLLRGTNGVAIASALRHYLKACGCHVTWDDPAPSLPARLPPLRAQVTSPWRYRYHFNFCTFGLHRVLGTGPLGAGDRLDGPARGEPALSVVGTEAIWLRCAGVWPRRRGGARPTPAFFPWTWTGCVHLSHGAPVTDAWVDAHVESGTGSWSASAASG